MSKRERRGGQKQQNKARPNTRKRKPNDGNPEPKTKTSRLDYGTDSRGLADRERRKERGRRGELANPGTNRV